MNKKELREKVAEFGGIGKLHEETGISRAYLTKILKDDDPSNPSVSTIEIISKALGLSGGKVFNAFCNDRH